MYKNDFARVRLRPSSLHHLANTRIHIDLTSVKITANTFVRPGKRTNIFRGRGKFTGAGNSNFPDRRGQTLRLDSVLTDSFPCPTCGGASVHPSNPSMGWVTRRLSSTPNLSSPKSPPVSKPFNFWWLPELKISPKINTRFFPVRWFIRVARMYSGCIGVDVFSNGVRVIVLFS